MTQLDCFKYYNLMLKVKFNTILSFVLSFMLSSVVND